MEDISSCCTERRALFYWNWWDPPLISHLTFRPPKPTHKFVPPARILLECHFKMFCKITKAILENDIKDFSLHAVTGEPGLPLILSFPQWVWCETFLARESLISGALRCLIKLETVGSLTLLLTEHPLQCWGWCWIFLSTLHSDWWPGVNPTHAVTLHRHKQSRHQHTPQVRSGRVKTNLQSSTFSGRSSPGLETRYEESGPAWFDFLSFNQKSNPNWQNTRPEEDDKVTKTGLRLGRNNN